MQTLHVVSHTHWDREWYKTFQQFRLQLVHLVDKLLTILDQNPEYLHFMLDGQTIVLEDYLQVRMANLPRLQPTQQLRDRRGRRGSRLLVHEDHGVTHRHGTIACE